MPDRSAIDFAILSVIGMFALSIVVAIEANIEDYRYRKTLTRDQLERHLEANRREMNIW
jgi:hypothetical protein